MSFETEDDTMIMIGFEQKIANTHPNICTQPPTHPQTSALDDYNKISLRLSLKMRGTKEITCDSTSTKNRIFLLTECVSKLLK